MCGIVGYFGNKNGAEVVVDGLKRLEYRGYDSWGLAAVGEGKLIKHKQVGKIGGFDLKRDLPKFGGEICIGHTRWATHGGVTETNSHPHFSCDKKIAVVHNGIVENYQELRSDLEKKGHKFVSQTDTEVIAHLIEQTLKITKDKTEAVRQSLKKLQGSYALGIIFEDEKLMIGARKGSPLVLGVGKDQTILGSDVPAFLKYTNKVVFLEEFEMVAISDQIKGGYEIKNVNSGKTVKPKITTIKWDATEAEKGGHPHFMIKEMLEQPQVIEKTIGMGKGELDKAAKMIEKAKRVYVVACGTALHAGMYGSYLLAKINKIMVQPISAGELHHFAPLFKKGDLVICVSQSGETADVLEAVKSAHSAGAKVLALVNVMGSSLMRAADFSLLTKAGPEICVLSTKAYVSQMAMFVMISGALSGKISNAKKVLGIAKKDIEKILSKKSLEKIKKMSKSLAKAQNIYALGRGINYPNALEACLKIKEVSYIHAEGFAGGDLKHGPIALIEKGVPVIIFASDDESEAEIISNAMEVKARGADVIGINYRNNEVFEQYLPIEKNGFYSPIASIVYPQLMAYYIALEKKFDPDKPRNLAKSVTVK
ncbi:MAG: Glutamine--fructose-6-phosphate aminotransferase (isomerizing) [candidate division WS2 bacterium ADurb.Bin280]|uniref:Glutamine--fructose-6-phosphate aminotransferase [isomerizing] n=1 Tax=candidate division WS2 bacterium ADurb.Bin280 TaxID=1852829 RepID=A0A1V5SFJ7_9BACT|nr:MAG: Glutamine--fructose-6-phosphate aminotransferase (isomerizing) [candidate division WS2 bacterium ADurb.Bin280]